MVVASPRIRAVAARGDNDFVETRQIGDMIRFGLAKARSRVSPVDGADELRVEGKTSIFVALMLLGFRLTLLPLTDAHCGSVP